MSFKGISTFPDIVRLVFNTWLAARQSRHGKLGRQRTWTVLNFECATNKFPQNLSFLAHDKISFMYKGNEQIQRESEVRVWDTTLSFEENPSLDLNFNILLIYCELWRWELLVFWSVFPRQLSSYRRIRLPDAWGRGGILDRELWIVSLSQKQTFAKFEVLQSHRRPLLCLLRAH